MIEKMSFVDFMQRAFRMDTLTTAQRSDTELSLRQAIERNPTCTALVLFENLQMDSSSHGASSVMTVGPDNTFKSVADCEGKWLRDTPSQRQYPVCFVTTADVKTPPAAPPPPPEAPKPVVPAWPKSWIDEEKEKERQLESAKAVTKTTYDRRIKKSSGKKGGR